MKFTDEDITLLEKFNSIVRRHYYVDGKQLTDLYNKVFGTQLKPTGCANCLKIRLNELNKALNSLKDNIKKEEESYEKLTAELNKQDNEETDTQAKADS